MRNYEKLELVNVRQGTRSTMRFSNGNTLPLTQLPFGMASFAPQTCAGRGQTLTHGGGWYFHPDDRSLVGIRITHQISPWINDYGQIVLFPHIGGITNDYSRTWSGFRQEQTELCPHCIETTFLRSRTRFSLAPTERGAKIALKTESSERLRFALLPVQGNCHYEVDAANRRIIDWTNAHTWPISDNFAQYFAIEFDCEICPKDVLVVHTDGSSNHALSITG